MAAITFSSSSISDQVSSWNCRHISLSMHFCSTWLSYYHPNCIQSETVDKQMILICLNTYRARLPGVSISTGVAFTPSWQLTLLVAYRSLNIPAEFYRRMPRCATSTCSDASVASMSVSASSIYRFKSQDADDTLHCRLLDQQWGSISFHGASDSISSSKQVMLLL